MITDFEIAFANARKQGLKEFNYQGKPYTTQYREEKAFSDVLNQYPALGNVYNDKNTVVSIANQNRLNQLKAVGGSNRQLEHWFPDDKGEPGLPHPTPGKYNFEFYNPELSKNSATMSSAIFLDALHGMKADPNYKVLRNQFNQNWSPDEFNWLKQKYAKEANKGEDFNSYMDRTELDAYLRGAMNPMTDEQLKSGAYPDEYAQNFRAGRGYSQTQRQIVEKMKAYLKNGK